MNPEQQIKQVAHTSGFALQGIAKVPDDFMAPRADRLETWLDEGRHGPLEYIKRNAPTRMNLKARFPWAKSVLCVGAFYDSKPEGIPGRDLVAHVARYARGRDYHLVFERRLKALAKELVSKGLCEQARWYVDTGPVLERAWAERAGLGWIGKNGCLITPYQGSYLLLGELFLDISVEEDHPHLNHCGTCTRCLEACPTQAFSAPGVLDARRCITTWNLEQKGMVEQSRWAEHYGWAAGCDICQMVCPYNASRRVAEPDIELMAPLPWQAMTLGEAITMTKETFEQAFRGSTLKRTGWKGLRLGAITASGNVRAESARGALESCLRDEDSDIRARAGWALGEMGE